MINDLKNIKSISILFYVFFLGGLVYYLFFPDHYNKITWESNIGKRYKQVDFILMTKMLIGKSKKEVQYLLGNSDENEFDKDEWFYSTSDAGFFGSAPSGLIIIFNNQKVKCAYK